MRTKYAAGCGLYGTLKAMHTIVRVRSSVASAVALCVLSLAAPLPGAAGGSGSGETVGQEAAEHPQVRTVVVHVVRALGAKSLRPDLATETDFRLFAADFNSYMAKAGAPQRIQIGEVTPWVRVPSDDACTLAAGRREAQQRGWDSSPTAKVLTYQPECARGVAGGVAEIGGTHLMVEGGTTSDVVAHELLHTFGLDHSSSPSCYVHFTPRGGQCPYRDNGIMFKGIYGDTSDLMGGIDRGSAKPGRTIERVPLTGLLSRSHLRTLGVQYSPADAYINLSDVNAPREIVLPNRASKNNGSFVHLVDSLGAQLTLSLSSGTDADIPYRVRDSSTGLAPRPRPAKPQLLAHAYDSGWPGGTTLLNAVPGSRLTIDGPGRFGSGLLAGLTYPVVDRGSGAPSHTLRIVSVSRHEAVLVLSSINRKTPYAYRAKAKPARQRATVSLKWKSSHARVIGVTALWRGRGQKVVTRYVKVPQGDTRLRIRSLPLLDGRGGWRFYLHTASPEQGLLGEVVYLPRGA